MPTGYTADVQSGKITEFRDFAMQCARAFGALITMRDDPADAPIPESFEPDDYHARQLRDAQTELDNLRRMTPEQHEALALAAYTKDMANYEQWEDGRRRNNARYEAMRAKVEAWQPPSPDHVEMKNFMLQQLDVSMERHEYSKPERLTGLTWLHQRVKQLQRDIEYHTEGRNKDIERAEGRTRWIQQLRDSLKDTP